jgi:hypothetical protein
MQRKLKFAIVLPITQLLIASTLLLWADRTYVPPPNFPLAWLICKGLNAPAILLLVPFGGTWYFLPPMPFVGRALFLMSVALIWYPVGRVLDQRKAAKRARERRVTVLVVQSLLLTAGGLLFYFGWNELRGSLLTDVGAFPSTWSVSLMGTFFTLTWSVSLIFLSGRALARMVPRGLARSE